MKLFYAPNSRAVRVAWCLEELGQPYETEKFALGDRQMRTPEYLTKHPMGRVPALEDGAVLMFESGAIVQYLLMRYGNGKLKPSDDSSEIAQYLQWFHYCEGMIMPPMNSYVVETILLPADRRSEPHARRAQKLLGQMLIAVEAHMTGREFLVSEFSAADIMTGHSVIMAQRMGVDFEPLPALRDYAARLQRRPAFQRAESL